MNQAGARSRLARFEFLGSPRFITALSTVTVAVAASSYAIANVVGWPGLIGIVATLVVLAAASAFMRRHSLDWQGILPISLIAFLAWCALSVLWSDYQWATLSSLLYQLAFAILAVYIALTRDMIQIVRIFGNVMRVLLGASIVLETFSGIIIDTPLAFLGIHGKLADGGPIQGIAGDSARLGILGLIAGITFTVELLTRSVQRVTAIVSLIGAVAVILLTHSNVVMLIGVAVVLAGLVLTGVRHVRPEVRQPLSWSLLAAGVVAVSIVVVMRGSILGALARSDQVANRSSLWRLVQDLTASNSLEGFGWIGHWRTELSPFFFFWQVRGSDYASAFNAFLDIWFQVGLVGLVIFCGLIGLALVRSWHLAVRQPSVVYLWPALILVALICTGFTESALIVDVCWLTLVICVVKSANKMSWRTAFERLRPPMQPDLREH
jgi:hypothetical protein